MVDVRYGESIYFDMYKWGLRHIPLDTIELDCAFAGVQIRDKDYRNYWNGWHNSSLYDGPASDDVFVLCPRWSREPGASEEFVQGKHYWTYPENPFKGLPEIENRWVPCNADNKPMIQWSKGCMTMGDAVALSRQKYLAENLKGTHLIVIDCDGNHGDELDWETMWFLNRWRDDTHCIVKPGYDTEIPQSFHLTFTTDRVIPTMHFPWAHIDIVGNRRNSLRYWKNKKWNGLAPAEMTAGRWAELQDYINRRRERANGNVIAGSVEQSGSTVSADERGVR